MRWIPNLEWTCNMLIKVMLKIAKCRNVVLTGPYGFSKNINAILVFRQLSLKDVSFLNSFQTDEERKDYRLPPVCECFWSHTFAFWPLSLPSSRSRDRSPAGFRVLSCVNISIGIYCQNSSCENHRPPATLLRFYAQL